jgi:class 3 adenylate cyclase
MTPPPQGFPPGYFTAVDSIHIHVDGVAAEQLVRDLVDEFNDKKLSSTFTTIKKSARGPQREDLPRTYQSHTPGSVGRRELDYFSTTRLKNLDEGREILNPLLKRLNKHEGIVIEAERIIGRIDDRKDDWSAIPLRELRLHSDEVGFQRGTTLPIEIHFACDIDKEGPWREKEPFELEQLVSDCTELGIRVGGWFLFEEDNSWAYRSNMFAEAVSKGGVRKQRDDLANRLTRRGNQSGFKCRVSAIVEESLGVWKTPLRRTGDRRSVQELAEWEEGFDFGDEGRFWVVAPDFLGDKLEDVKRAMLHNFRRNVDYTYFLGSFADVERLRDFAERLRKDIPDVFDHITAVLLYGDATKLDAIRSIFRREYFIANPGFPNAQGFRLFRSSDREVSEGIPMRLNDIESVFNELSPLIDTKRRIQGIQLPLERDYIETASAKAVVYTDLKGSTARQNQLGDAQWEEVLKKYDVVLAREVSKSSGEVVKNLGDGYLLIFDRPGEALRCAEKLQRAVVDHNALCVDALQIPAQKIALDFGIVNRVMRAQGFDFAGKPLSRCARLMQIMNGPEIFMTNAFRENASPQYPEISRRIEELSGPPLKDYEAPGETQRIFRFLWHCTDPSIWLLQ